MHAQIRSCPWEPPPFVGVFLFKGSILRAPKSVLAKHYTDYGPENLKEIYGQADLKVLA